MRLRPLISLALLLSSLCLMAPSAEPAQAKNKNKGKNDEKIALSTLRNYEKSFYRLDRVGLSDEGKKLARSELVCADEILAGIEKSKIPENEKFSYIWDMIIVFQAHALALSTKDRTANVLFHGKRLKGASRRLEKKAKSRRGVRIARGLLAQEVLGRDYLLMPEVNFCAERDYLAEEGYDSDTIYSAYLEIVSWEVFEWATSKSAEKAFNMLYQSYDAIFNTLPKLKEKRLLRFEKMYFAALLPWEKWKGSGLSKDRHLGKTSPLPKASSFRLDLSFPIG